MKMEAAGVLPADTLSVQAAKPLSSRFRNARRNHAGGIGLSCSTDSFHNGGNIQIAKITEPLSRGHAQCERPELLTTQETPRWYTNSIFEAKISRPELLHSDGLNQR